MDNSGMTYRMAFARNPLIVERDWPAVEKAAVGTFSVASAGAEVFTGRFSPPVSVNLSDIAETIVRPYPEVPPENRRPVVPLEDAATFALRRMDAAFMLGGHTEDVSRYILPGGVSLQNFRQYAAEGVDAFAARFLNDQANFFLTTRSNAWRLEVSEAELYPFYFLNPEGYTIRVTELCGGHSREFSGLETGVVGALDVRALRRSFFMENKVLASVFDIYRGSGHSCRLAVTRSDPSVQSVRVCFRNSLGVYEIIRVEGKVIIKPGMDEEDSVFNRFDPLTASFAEARDRLRLKHSVSVETSLPDTRKARFFCDMLASEDVLLLDLCGLPVKVIPSADEISYPARSESPLKVTLNLDMCEREIGITDFVASASDSHRPRIFSSQFNETFN